MSKLIDNIPSAYAVYKGSQSERKRKSEIKPDADRNTSIIKKPKVSTDRKPSNASNIIEKIINLKKNYQQRNSKTIETKTKSVKGNTENVHVKDDGSKDHTSDDIEQKISDNSKNRDKLINSKKTKHKSKLSVNGETSHNQKSSPVKQIKTKIRKEKRELNENYSSISSAKTKNVKRDEPSTNGNSQDQISKKCITEKNTENKSNVIAKSRKKVQFQIDKFNNLESEKVLPKEEDSMDYFQSPGKNRRNAVNQKGGNSGNGTVNAKKESWSPPPALRRFLVTVDLSASAVTRNSVKSGRDAFHMLINPIDIPEFFKDTWEKQPLVIERNRPDYFSALLSSEDIDIALRKQKLFFTKNIDITSYSPVDQVRQTLNPPGRATAPLVWNYYEDGCSIRILNPQTFFPTIHALNARLQEFFECFVGANVYLTPAGYQGFAPHYDDIEAVVLQIEGEKLWKVYAPRNPKEMLPRTSSPNFRHEDLGPPLHEVLLKAGDTLYFPRGYIHEAVASSTSHSLHITISMYQKNSWADFMEIVLPAALKIAVDNDVSFRQGLPLQYLSHIGSVHSDKQSSKRDLFNSLFQNLMTKLVEHAPLDAAADQMAKEFMHAALPPYFRTVEKNISALGDGERIQNGVVLNHVKFGLDTSIKLVRYNCMRIVPEEDTVRIYYSIHNSLEYHGEEPQCLETDADSAVVFEALIEAYPKYITVNKLPVEDNAAKLQLVRDLWELGLLFTKEPLNKCTNGYY